MKSSFKEYFIQTILIIFSVLLALFLNEYRNDLRSKKELDKILNNVLLEIETNKQIVDEVIPYHIEAIQVIDSAIEHEEFRQSLKSEYGLNFFKIAPRGVLQNFVNHTAWETAKMSASFSELDPHTMQKLTMIYDQQELTFTPVYKIMDMIYSRDFQDNDKIKENLLLIRWQFFELKGREVRLQKFYENTLENR